jgi:uncharacterized protein
MPDWKFYGGTEPLAELRCVVEAKNWLFCRMDGRSRIGKTTQLGRRTEFSRSLS